MVAVRWEDAICLGTSGWNDPAELDDWAKTPPPIMHTIGYLIHEDPGYIVVCDSIGPDEVGCANKIPQSMIKDMWELKAPTPALDERSLS